MGTVLFEMLAGTRPFNGNTAAEALTAIIREEPEPLGQRASGVPALVRWIIERLLVKEAIGRYDSTRDLAALRLHLSESTASGSAGTGVAAPPISRRRVVARAAAALGIAALVFGAGVFLDRLVVPGRRVAAVSSPAFQRLTTSDGIETWPALSPGGKTIAANRSGRLLLIPWPRSPEDPLPEPVPLLGDGLKFLPYSWSADSKELAGFVIRADASVSGEIVVYEVEKKSNRTVATTGQFPTFLRDGRRIAFLDGTALKIVDIASGRISEILKGDPRRAIEVFGIAPDDKSLFVSWASTQADLRLMELGGTR